jgi:hypothetical protein
MASEHQELAMAQEERNRLAEWTVMLREQIPILRGRLAEWAAVCREHPRLIWETPAVRYATYGLGGLIVLWGVLAVAGAIAPAPPVDAGPEAAKADFHVICSNPGCAYHFVIQREFSFRKFPVQCPKCVQKTGQRAYPCYSQTCQRRWVVPAESGGVPVCPRCGEPL